MKTGIELIGEERERQLEKEQWDLGHDLEHFAGDLALAGACYAVNKHPRAFFCVSSKYSYHPWDAFPFSKKWDKREKHDRLRSLTIAGALIAAEIDREQAGMLEDKDFTEYQTRVIQNAHHLKNKKGL